MNRRLFRDVKDDLARRLPLYASDWIDGFHPIILSASLFMFFTSFFPALIFGEQLMDKTGGLLGIPEVLLATGLTGCVWSLVAGQPLLVVGVTGPVTIFTTAIYGIAKDQQMDFFQLQCWTCIWSALMHWAIAATGACSAVRRVTRFSGETFALFIAAIYIYSALAELFDFRPPKAYQSAVTDGWFGFGSFYIAITCHYARDWTFFNRGTRELIAQCGAVIAIGTWTAVASVGVFRAHHPDLLDVPTDYQWTPTARFYPQPTASAVAVVNATANTTSAAEAAGTHTHMHENAGAYCHSAETRTGGLAFGAFCHTHRPWLVDPSQAPLATAAAAFPCALLLTLLFFFDHNVSSQLAQDARFRLRKGPAFHWDFLVLGANVLACGLLGLPPTNGLIPQAPLHVRALATIRVREAGDEKDKNKSESKSNKCRGDDSDSDSDSGSGSGTGPAEFFESVREQRVSNLLQSAAMVLVMLRFDAPGAIPKGVLRGLFLYMGVTTLDGLSVWERARMLLQEPTRTPAYAYLRPPPPPPAPAPLHTHGKIEAGVGAGVGVGLEAGAGDGTGAEAGTEAEAERGVEAEAEEEAGAAAAAWRAWRGVLRQYTLVQLALWGVIFGCSGPWAEPYSIVFPFLIAALVPVRERVLPMLFGAQAVNFIDTCGEQKGEEGENGEKERSHGHGRGRDDDRGRAGASEGAGAGAEDPAQRATNSALGAGVKTSCAATPTPSSPVSLSNPRVEHTDSI